MAFGSCRYVSALSVSLSLSFASLVLFSLSSIGPVRSVKDVSMYRVDPSSQYYALVSYSTIVPCIAASHASLSLFRFVLAGVYRRVITQTAPVVTVTPSTPLVLRLVLGW